MDILNKLRLDKELELKKAELDISQQEKEKEAALREKLEEKFSQEKLNIVQKES